jgi:hypothetical protein
MVVVVVHAVVVADQVADAKGFAVLPASADFGWQ